MNGLRPAVLLLTALLIVGLLGSALYHTVSGGGKESVILASVAPTCQPDPTNPQRIVLPQGSQVMDFTLTSLDGKAVKLSQELAKAPDLLQHPWQPDGLPVKPVAGAVRYSAPSWTFYCRGSASNRASLCLFESCSATRTLAEWLAEIWRNEPSE